MKTNAALTPQKMLHGRLKYLTDLLSQATLYIIESDNKKNKKLLMDVLCGLHSFADEMKIVPRGKVVIGLSLPDRTQMSIESDALTHFRGGDHALNSNTDYSRQEQVVIGFKYLWALWKPMMEKGARMVEGNPNHVDFDSDMYEWILADAQDTIRNWNEKFGNIPRGEGQRFQKIEYRAARPEF